MVFPLFHQPPQATSTSLKLPQPSITSPTVYLNHQQSLQQQSVGVQTQRFSLSPPPSSIHFRVPERRSLSSTPSVSPLSTPSGSPSLLKMVSPPQRGATAAIYPTPSCSIVLPARTSPPALHLPEVSANQFLARVWTASCLSISLLLFTTDLFCSNNVLCRHDSAT